MDKIEITIDLSDVTNKSLLQIKETTESVARIYHAIENLDIDIHKPLPTEDFPILIDDKKETSSAQELKEITINWVLKKGFEDFIGVVILSFKEAYKFLKIYNLSIETKNRNTREEIEAKLEKVNAEIENFFIPEFIQNIEKLLEKPLPFKEEVLSINRVRNCLVHRHGIVSEKDIRYSQDGTLHLKWISIQSYTMVNGKKKIITYDLRKEGVTVYNLSHEFVSNEKIFKLGDKISLDINDFNGIATTCSQLVYSLFPLMPRP